MGHGIAARIRSELEEKILSGTWPPGTRLPYEHELMAQYRCSRMTVSKVLDGISDRGLIVRRRRSGSYVAQPPAEHALLEIRGFDDVAAIAGRSYRYRLLARGIRTISTAESAVLAVDAASRIVDLTCLHVLDEEPVAWEHRLIVLSTVPEAETAEFETVPPGSWLLQHVPWTIAHHVVGAITPPAPLARLLRIETDTACLELRRRTWLRDALVTDVRMVHPGKSYRLSGTFAPNATQLNARP